MGDETTADIVERLRERVRWGMLGEADPELCGEAADEIERLRPLARLGQAVIDCPKYDGSDNSRFWGREECLEDIYEAAGLERPNSPFRAR